MTNILFVGILGSSVHPLTIIETPLGWKNDKLNQFLITCISSETSLLMCAAYFLMRDTLVGVQTWTETSPACSSSNFLNNSPSVF